MYACYKRQWYLQSGRVQCTCLDNITHRVQPHGVHEVVYAGYRVIMFSSHEHNDSLCNTAAQVNRLGSMRYAL